MIISWKNSHSSSPFFRLPIFKEMQKLKVYSRNRWTSPSCLVKDMYILCIFYHINPRHPHWTWIWLDVVKSAVHVLLTWFSLDFILILSWFYPDFILILSWFYPDFILILSWFYPDFILILFWFYPDFIQIF